MYRTFEKRDLYYVKLTLYRTFEGEKHLHASAAGQHFLGVIGEETLDLWQSHIPRRQKKKDRV